MSDTFSTPRTLCTCCKGTGWEPRLRRPCWSCVTTGYAEGRYPDKHYPMSSRSEADLRRLEVTASRTLRQVAKERRRRDEEELQERRYWADWRVQACAVPSCTQNAKPRADYCEECAAGAVRSFLDLLGV